MTDLIDDVPEAFLAKHPYDGYVRLLDRDMKPQGYDPEMVALAALNNLVAVMRSAAKAEQLALSWRNYKVTAAVLAYNFELPAMGVFVGANYKPQQGSGPNIHAEQVALAKARRFQLDQAVAIGVRADPDDTDANPGGLLTLPPCGRCADMFSDAPEVKPETLLLSANMKLSVCELYTASELYDYRARPDAKGPIGDVPAYSLADDMDDDLYTHQILLPLLVPKIMELYATRKML